MPTNVVGSPTNQLRIHTSPPLVFTVVWSGLALVVHNATGGACAVPPWQ